MLTLTPWLRSYLSGFCTVNFLFSSLPFHTTLWKKVSMCSPYIRSRGLPCNSFRVEYPHQLFQIFLHRRFVSFPLLIYAVIYISMDSWISISYFQLKSNTIFFYSNCSGFGHWELFQWAPYLFYMLSLLQGFVLVLPYFLVWQEAPSSSYVFPAPVLESILSPKSSGSFSWRIVLKIKMFKLCSSLLKCYSF